MLMYLTNILVSSNSSHIMFTFGLRLLERHEPPYPLGIGWIVPLLFFYMDGYGIR